MLLLIYKEALYLYQSNLPGTCMCGLLKENIFMVSLLCSDGMRLTLLALGLEIAHYTCPR
jgi:hypothetical protein